MFPYSLRNISKLIGNPSKIFAVLCLAVLFSQCREDTGEVNDTLSTFVAPEIITETEREQLARSLPVPGAGAIPLPANTGMIQVKLQSPIDPPNLKFTFEIYAIEGDCTINPDEYTMDVSLTGQVSPHICFETNPSNHVATINDFPHIFDKSKGNSKRAERLGEPKFIDIYQNTVDIRQIEGKDIKFAKEYQFIIKFYNEDGQRFITLFNATSCRSGTLLMGLNRKDSAMGSWIVKLWENSDSSGSVSTRQYGSYVTPGGSEIVIMRPKTVSKTTTQPVNFWVTVADQDTADKLNLPITAESTSFEDLTDVGNNVGIFENKFFSIESFGKQFVTSRDGKSLRIYETNPGYILPIFNDSTLAPSNIKFTIDKNSSGDPGLWVSRGKKDPVTEGVFFKYSDDRYEKTRDGIPIILTDRDWLRETKLDPHYFGDIIYESTSDLGDDGKKIRLKFHSQVIFKKFPDMTFLALSRNSGNLITGINYDAVSDGRLNVGDFVDLTYSNNWVDTGYHSSFPDVSIILNEAETEGLLTGGLFFYHFQNNLRIRHIREGLKPFIKLENGTIVPKATLRRYIKHSTENIVTFSSFNDKISEQNIVEIDPIKFSGGKATHLNVTFTKYRHSIDETDDSTDPFYEKFTVKHDGVTDPTKTRGSSKELARDVTIGFVRVSN